MHIEMRCFNGDERSLDELVKHLVVDQRNKFRVRNDNLLALQRIANLS